MLLQTILFAVGLAALYFGAEWLVRGAARLARLLGVTPVVIGLTVVSFGTSAPELVVSGLAALRDNADVAAGNVVGSNIINVALILGVSAMIYPLRVQMRLLAREVPLMIGALLLPLAFGLDGSIGRFDGTLLLLGFVGYIVFVLRAAGRESDEIAAEYREFEAAESLEPKGERVWWDVVLIVAGVAALVVGAQLLVGAALYFARVMGLSELVIGLTIVAIGTSLPELATSIMAAFRREADIALGNIVGSNVFNVLSILGVATVIRPIAVEASLLRFDIPVMIGLSVLLLPLGLRRQRLGRLEGGILVAAYLAYIAAVLVRSGAAG